MKAQISTVNLATIATVAGRFANKGSILPILQGVKLDGKGAAMRFAATDLDVTIEGHVYADVTEDGATVVNCKALTDMVKGCNCVVDVTADEKNNVTLASGPMRASLLGLPADDFPVVSYKPGKAFIMEQGTLLALLKQCQHATSDDQTRYVLLGVYLEKTAQQLTATAIDGKRLFTSAVVLPDNAAVFSAILPNDAVERLTRLLTEDGGAVAVELMEDERSALRFTFDAIIGKGKRAVTVPVVITAKTIDGQYPDCRKVIPVDYKATVQIESGALLAILSALRPCRGKRSDAVKLTFEPCQLTATVATEDAQQISQVIACTYNDKPLTIAVDLDYLAQAVKAFDAATVRIELTDDVSPLALRANTVDGLAVIMPMRLN